MGFSSDDIQASVEKLVLSSIRRPLDTLGTRRVDISFSDVQEAAAGVFLLVASAPFYVAYLGAQTLEELVQSESANINNLLAAIDATGHQVSPIKDLTTLNNASAALFDLEAAVGQRSQSFKTIESVPAYQRFKSNLDQFLSTAGSNVKANGDIVQTPQEARAAIPGLVTSLQASHAELVRRAKVLANAVDDYASVNLPALAAAGVISRASQLIQQHAQTLSSLGETDRLGVLRPIVLDLLTSKAVVAKYGSFVVPTTVLNITGLGTPYSDSTRRANGGIVTGDKHSPFAILAGENTLDLRFDVVVAAKVNGIVDTVTTVNGYKAQFNRAAGSFITNGVTVGDVVYVNSGLNDGSRWMVTNVTANAVQAMGSIIPLTDGVTSIEIWPKADESIPLALSYVASIDGAAREPFSVVGGVSDTLTIVLAGLPVTFAFSPGSQTAAQLAAAMNSQLAFFGLDTFAVAEAFLSPLKFDGVVDITTLGPVGTFTLQVSQLDGLGVIVGDLIEILSGPSAGLIISVVAVGSAPITSIQGIDGALVPATGVRIQIGSAGMKLRVRLLHPELALPNAWTLSVAADTFSAATALLLGFPTGATFTSRPTRAVELVTDLNNKLARGLAARVLTPITTATLGRSKPENVSAVVLYRFRGTGDVVASPGAVAITVAAGGLLGTGVMVGDILALRTGADPDSVWTITAVTDTTLNAVGGTTTSATGLIIEVGPALAAPAGRLLNITSGPNAGELTVTGSQAVPFDLLIDGFLPIAQTSFTQPAFFSASLNFETVSVSSKNATTASRVTMNGFAADALSTVVPLAGSGTTTWFQLPSVPRDLNGGDHLDVYPSNYLTPSDSFSIVVVDPSSGVIQLDHALSSTVSWAFGDQPPPFARLRSGRVYNYTVLQLQLTTWALLSVNQPAFFTDLNRFLNPLLVNTNPTDVQINDARMRLLSLAAVLDVAGATLSNTSPAATLEAALEGYVVVPVPEVDTLFQSFKEKGSDRAIDLLTEGQFTTFFGLSLDGASYSGDMQQKMRDVARNDLPIRKVDRNDASSSRQIAEVQDTDFEYSKDDIDDVQIDPPVA